MQLASQTKDPDQKMSPSIYAALIDSGEAWEPEPRKFKTPEDLVFSTLRAFGTAPGKPEDVLRSFELLGQRQYTPGSPAGWPDVARAWDGSDALMHRVLWASRARSKRNPRARPEESGGPADSLS